MANLYAASTGSNTAPYDTWAKAATNPSTAVNAAAAGDTVYIHAESFSISAATETWTLAGTSTNPVRVICSNDKANEPPQTLGSAKYTQATTANHMIINGIGYINGFTFETTGASTSAITLIIASTDADDIVMENCGFVLAATNTSSTSRLQIGVSAENNSRVRLINPTIVFGNNAGQGISLYQSLIIEGGSISSTGSLTSLFKYVGRSPNTTLDGTDLSGCPGTIINPGSQTVGTSFELRNFRHHASATLVGAYTDVAQPEVYLSNYGSGDTHYNFAHYSSRGSTIMETGIYANDGQTYDGTNKITWKIVTTGYASQAMPYVSQWVEKYHSATSAITPYFEILRDGSTTAYTNAEVWAEFSYQGTSGYPKANFSNDEAAWLSTATNQAAGVGTSGWTGDTGAWSGKIDSGSAITPAEIGMLRGRICVGVASSTVYLDPKIRT